MLLAQTGDVAVVTLLLDETVVILGGSPRAR